MARPEEYQIPFLFPDRSAVRYEYGFVSHDNPEDGSRFVRKLRETVQVRTPNDVACHLMANVFNPFDAFDQEELWSLQLDTKNRITHEAMVYRGTVNAVHVRIAELFKEAVRVNAPSIILSHVHPSGDAAVSPEDVRVTESCVKAGKLLGIELLDHIVVGRDSWVSMKERNLGFQPRSLGWDDMP
jgi:DNA repair protein RadC